MDYPWHLKVRVTYFLYLNEHIIEMIKLMLKSNKWQRLHWHFYLGLQYFHMRFRLIRQIASDDDDGDDDDDDDDDEQWMMMMMDCVDDDC